MNVICTTTINAPTEAIRKFDAMKDWTLVVAGDRKTPGDYKLERGIYLTPDMQEKAFREVSDLIGWNCIQRRNLAFLWAMKELKADIVATVDDDNIPMDHWGKRIMLQRGWPVEFHNTVEPVFDPLYHTTPHLLWHRGFPLQDVPRRRNYPTRTIIGNFDIQADLWNGEPDVDAICRMTNPMQVRFIEGLQPFTSTAPSPFNSQNTFLRKEVMPHYFMFPGIGRMDDIWAAYHVQGHGFKVVYNRPSVVQERNPHDITEDMKKEYLGYEHNHRIVREIVTDKDAVLNRLPPWSREAFRAYQKCYE